MYELGPGSSILAWLRNTVINDGIAVTVSETRWACTGVEIDSIDAGSSILTRLRNTIVDDASTIVTSVARYTSTCMCRN